MNRIVDVSITAPDADWLADHARQLIEDRLAASGNVIPSIRSVYRWRDEIEHSSEAYLILHTRDELVPAIVERTNAAHPYDTVHVLATEIVDADPRYQQWILDSTSSPADECEGHRSRLCHFVVDCDDLDAGLRFWAEALGATEEPVAEQSQHVYRRLALPESNVRLLLQRTNDPKSSKERMHLDIETDDVEAEVKRLEALGATRYQHQSARGFDYWILRDPWGNELCVLQPTFPDLLASRQPHC